VQQERRPHVAEFGLRIFCDFRFLKAENAHSILLAENSIESSFLRKSQYTIFLWQMQLTTEAIPERRHKDLSKTGNILYFGQSISSPQVNDFLFFNYFFIAQRVCQGAAHGAHHSSLISLFACLHL
tara:strand:- start:218 stop:595 length:378 start_codon:yes stop_codon:yes gene_type:complete